ncbi:MAG TPA: type II toxin-antitoxin system HicA family toxin [Xanthobacteraceae bacterium]
MLMNSRDIKRRLEREGWRLERVSGSHHVFKHPQSRRTVILPHPKKDCIRTVKTARVLGRLDALDALVLTPISVA